MPDPVVPCDLLKAATSNVTAAATTRAAPSTKRGASK